MKIGDKVRFLSEVAKNVQTSPRKARAAKPQARG